MQQPLRYEIDDWSQVVECKSNSSRELHLLYTEVRDMPVLSGVVISVWHERFGTLFTYLVKGSGNLIIADPTDTVHELSNDDILKELYKFGFDIRFHEIYGLVGSQVNLLVLASQFKMDKIRFLYVLPEKTEFNSAPPKRRMVVFNMSKNPRWLQNTYVCPFKEFTKALADGTAINFDDQETIQKDNWGFLEGKVLDINDILREFNTEVI